MEEVDWEFNTFRDKVLIDLLGTVKRFCNDVLNSKYYTLTLSGPTELGKTHLLKKAYKFFLRTEKQFKHESFDSKRVVYDSWDNIVKRELNKEDYISKLSQCGILFIEEFLNFRLKNDYTYLQLELAQKLLNGRLGKPTLIETNKEYITISELDGPVASRLKRNGSIFVKIPPETTKYLSRVH